MSHPFQKIIFKKVSFFALFLKTIVILLCCKIFAGDCKVKPMRFIFFIRYQTAFGEDLFIEIKDDGADRKNTCKLMPMQYFNNEYWRLELDITATVFEYRYILKDLQGGFVSEPLFDRRINVTAFNDVDILTVYDQWNDASDSANVFLTAPFKNILLQQPPVSEACNTGMNSHRFFVKAPLLKEAEAVCILGDQPKLGGWDVDKAVLMSKAGDWWLINIDLKDGEFPIAYKYGIFDVSNKKLIRYEEGGNRVCFEQVRKRGKVVLHDGFLKMPANTWKGAGVSIPVFSLRTTSSLGIGEFNDLKLMVDWALKTKLKLIQLLPINDTTATFLWKDSYPYAAISAFALHPVYLNVEKVANKKYDDIENGLLIKQRQLNALTAVDYEAVLHLKFSLLKNIFEERGVKDLNGLAYQEFAEKNKEWLVPYAAFCYLRDKYKTPDASKWKANSVYKQKEIEKFFKPKSAANKKVNFYCWLQYHLHTQLRETVDYAHKNSIVLKGDIPIGVYRYGVDVWKAPELYKMDQQAGAPPDDFAINGQNWGFPTYNWEKMQDTGFAWWKQRFEQMGQYFDAFRIDHILGFFRIWSIPLHAVKGIMGRFDPCLPVYKKEFGENGIWFDVNRFCKPYITDAVLHELFGDESGTIIKNFLQRSGPETYEMRPEFDTQRKVENWFNEKSNGDKNDVLKNKLFDLISNVILFEQEGSSGSEFHFRIGIDKTLSFQYLSDDVKHRLWNLYVDYFFKRQDGFWRKEALKKLPALKEATNMLVCGEDLGMVPDCVPKVMKQLGLLSLEVQRMPKQSGIEFFNPDDAPYLSVVTPSTHDMSTIRGWWEEDREISQRFFNLVLGQSGEAPLRCEPWINRAIVAQHLFSPAMWSIFQIQDLMGISEKLRRESSEDERINIPANPHHYWRYRMHINLEQLLNEEDFNNELKCFIRNSGR